MGVAAAAAFLKIGLGWGRMLGLITGKGGVIKGLISLGWLGLVILAVGALYLIFDDLFTLFTGGESLIGGLIDDLFGVGTTGEVVEYLKGLWTELQQIWQDFEPLFQLFGQWLSEAFAAAWPYMVQFEKFVLQNMVVAFRNFISLVRTGAGELGAFFQIAGKALSIAGKLSGNQSVLDAGNALNKVGIGLERSSEATAGVPDATDKALRVTEMHQQNRVHIEVKGGPTNAQTGRSVAGALGGVLNNQNAHAADALGSEDDEDE
jgi:hypothetical protein